MKLPGQEDKHFEQVVRAYSADLYRYAYWLCRERFLAEELVQEAFLRAWKGWRTLRDPAATKAWLFTIVRNEYARAFARKRIDIVDVDVYELDIADSRPTVAGVEGMLAALPLAYREPLALQVLGGFSCAEIAAMLHTTEGAVMTRLTRARQALRTHEAGREKQKGAR
ncbi:MAG: RNA polymerase subunit sigma [Betaproteobacteria bacterium RIFCSPLOWO2_02_FULL_65_24]|nr:MAG: RNA polymerase subunit sigma [Betaproteobacteria bacterium RIFCSPLOWO2_02_FULL_65_24]OGA81949.1 MAG: RNA polymerase subunit sigma [Betaproteobacteria bacterium RIFCSPLOWO2_12_FULL_66_14]